MENKFKDGLTLFDERSQRADVALDLPKIGFYNIQPLFLLGVARQQLLVVFCRNYRRIVNVAHDGFDIFILRVLFQILEFEFPQK